MPKGDVQLIQRLQGGEFHWELRFLGNLRDWEVTKFQSSIEFLHKQSVSQTSHDEWRWGAGNDGFFSVQPYNEKLLVRRSPQEG